MSATRCAEDRVVEAREDYLLWAKRAQRHRCPCWLVRVGWPCVFAPYVAAKIDAASLAYDLANAQASEARLRAGVPT